ncbi:MAG: RNA 2',3'-cyclic phosphodiesterase [Candidatus Dormibacteraeota bacterium]|nr:RNA 2',3'-cyclic phosphodiesterase [Candidatus Dormibacteraeota bacterium]
MSEAAITEKPWRLFVAALLTDANRRALSGTISQLASVTPGVNPSRIDAIHLTLHFLGSVEVERVEALSRGLDEAVTPFTRFQVDVMGVGAFPSLSRPRVLWAGVGGPKRERLVEIQQATGNALRNAGLVVEARAYAPHLTLARVRTMAGAGNRTAIARWAAEWKDAAFGALPIKAVHLMRSDLSERPPRYSSVRSFPLQ